MYLYSVMLWKTLLGSVSTYTDKLSTKICLWPSATMNCIDCSVWQHQNGQGLSVPLGASPSWLESTAAIRTTTPVVCAPPYQGYVAPGDRTGSRCWEVERVTSYTLSSSSSKIILLQCHPEEQGLQHTDTDMVKYVQKMFTRYETVTLLFL